MWYVTIAEGGITRFVWTKVPFEGSFNNCIGQTKILASVCFRNALVHATLYTSNVS